MAFWTRNQIYWLIQTDFFFFFILHRSLLKYKIKHLPGWKICCKPFCYFFCVPLRPPFWKKKNVGCLSYTDKRCIFLFSYKIKGLLAKSRAKMLTAKKKKLALKWGKRIVIRSLEVAGGFSWGDLVNRKHKQKIGWLAPEAIAICKTLDLTGKHGFR